MEAGVVNTVASNNTMPEARDHSRHNSHSTPQDLKYDADKQIAWEIFDDVSQLFMHLSMSRRDTLTRRPIRVATSNMVSRRRPVRPTKAATDRHLSNSSRLDSLLVALVALVA